MDRLFRPQYLAVALVTIICLVLMVLVLPRVPDKICTMPLWALLFTEYIFTGIVLACAQLQSLRQSLYNFRLVPGCISIGLALLIAAMGVIVSPISSLGSDGNISIGLAQLTIINLAILFSVFSLTKIDHTIEHELATDEEDKNRASSTNIKRLTKIRMKAVEGKSEAQELKLDDLDLLNKIPTPAIPSMGKPLGGRTSLRPPQDMIKKPNLPSDISTSSQPVIPKPQQTPSRKAVDISTVERLLIPGSQSLQNQKAINKEMPPEVKRLPSVNPPKVQNKIAPPNRPMSATASKLKGLSASGRGAIHNLDEQNTSIDQADLKSVLNRLDSTEEAQPNTLFKQPVDKEMDDLFAQIAPEAQSEIGAKEIEPRLFKEGVDNQVEDIFAGMVPAEAQREVGNAVAKSNIVESTEPVVQVNDISAGPSLFKQPVDQEMDNLFAQIAPEAQPEVKAKYAASQPISQPIPSEVSAEPKLFKGKVDDQVDDIFSDMAPPEAQKEVKDRIAQIPETPKTPDTSEASSTSEEITGDRSAVVASFDPGVHEAKSHVPELKDFGRLSSRASAESESVTQAGTMKTIGKLLIDAQSVENIIKKAETGRITVNLPSAKVISRTRGEGIQNLLHAIDGYDGVEGSMLVGADGLVISSTFASTGDRDGTGVLAHGMLGNSNLGMLRLDLGKLEQMILVTKSGEQNSRQLTTILTDVEVGMLAVFLDIRLLTGLDKLLEQVSTVARG